MQAPGSKKKILGRLRDHHTRIRAFGVKRLGLFGSFVRGEEGPHSDVDLLVEFEPERKTFDNFMGLSLFLEELFDRRVELVTVESLSPYLKPYIIEEVEYASLSV